MRQATPDGLMLRPPGAIHLSTARRAACAGFLTYGTNPHKYAGMSGMAVTEPISGQLPLESGQGNG
jgi:hypothetical protein